MSMVVISYQEDLKASVGSWNDWLYLQLLKNERIVLWYAIPIGIDVSFL